jgi:mannose-6-phosphate isomerase
VGADLPHLGFREHLTLAGAPAGWPGGCVSAQRGYDFIVREGKRSDGAWVRSVGADGGIVDATADLYDLAFVLFAIAYYARATGDAESLSEARRTLAWINAHMSHPAGGFYNTWPIEPGPRLQNPHMHLLEAVLALYETTGDGAYLDQATSLVTLFQTRFFDANTGTLGEYFTDELTIPAGPEGHHVEPGHHYEWVWLLDQYARASGATPLVESARLYAFAEAHGVHPESRMPYDCVDRSGRVLRATTRLWPQT